MNPYDTNNMPGRAGFDIFTAANDFRNAYGRNPTIQELVQQAGRFKHGAVSGGSGTAGTLLGKLGDQAKGYLMSQIPGTTANSVMNLGSGLGQSLGASGGSGLADAGAQALGADSYAAGDAAASGAASSSSFLSSL